MAYCVLKDAVELGRKPNILISRIFLRITRLDCICVRFKWVAKCDWHLVCIDEFAQLKLTACPPTLSFFFVETTYPFLVSRKQSPSYCWNVHSKIQNPFLFTSSSKMPQINIKSHFLSWVTIFGLGKSLSRNVPFEKVFLFLVLCDPLASWNSLFCASEYSWGWNFSNPYYVQWHWKLNFIF